MNRVTTINPHSLEFFHDALGSSELPVLADMNRRMPRKKSASKPKFNSKARRNETSVTITMGGVDYKVTGSDIRYPDDGVDTIISFAANKDKFGELIQTMAGSSNDNKKKLQDLKSANINQFITSGGESFVEGVSSFLEGFTGTGTEDLFWFGKTAAEDGSTVDAGGSGTKKTDGGGGIGTGGAIAIGLGVVALVGVTLYFVTRD
jgi:5'-3' exonuclease